MFRLLLLIAMTVGCAQAQSEPQRNETKRPLFSSGPIVNRFERDMDSRIRMAEDADAALGNWIKHAKETLTDEADKLDRKADKLQSRGALVDALTIREKATKIREMGQDFQDEWLADYKGFIPKAVGLGPLGRETPELYQPMFEWLREWYHALKDVLDEKILVALHIDDLQVFNEGTPVVLRLKSMGDNLPGTEVYAAYFNPWTAMVAYWLVYAGCEAACWGLDISLLCSPIAMAAEEMVFRVIAPRWSDKFYVRIYQ